MVDIPPTVRFTGWMGERYAVYILASKRNGTLYIGVTGNLSQRIEQHRALAVRGFTQRYRVTQLVYVERFAEINDAIAREKQLKGWNRAWKLKLIEQSNPDWLTLSAD
jgi:putative endonuclease